MAGKDRIARVLRWYGKIMKRPLIWIIYAYKILISPILPPSCRFYPTCSDYARLAVEEHGAAKGLVLAVRRILRCHPYHPGGYDPVPHAHDCGCGSEIAK